jgi:hypothetical protein
MTAPFVISTKWNTCLEWITKWHYPELRSYFTLKSLLHSGLKRSGLFKVILVGTGVQLKLRKHPNAYIAIKWNLNLLVITLPFGPVTNFLLAQKKNLGPHFRHWIVFGLTRPRLKPVICHTGDEDANHWLTHRCN